MTHYVSYLNLEGEVSSCKMNRFIGNLSSNWKWAWQAQFLSYWPITLENWISFRDVQMVLVSFFEIPYGDRLTKNVQKLRVQVIPRSTAKGNSVLQIGSCRKATFFLESKHFNNISIFNNSFLKLPFRNLFDFRNLCLFWLYTTEC